MIKSQNVLLNLKTQKGSRIRSGGFAIRPGIGGSACGYEKCKTDMAIR
jgi:hypothetical protein